MATYMEQDADGDEGELEQELGLLQAIYIHELEVQNDDSGHPGVLSITLHPSTADNADLQYVCLTLVLTLTHQYPDVIPDIAIKNPRGISDEQLKSISNQLHELATDQTGSAMLYELIEAAKEAITHNNTPHGQCVICLQDFQEGEAFTKTACYHHFHCDCLARYIQHALENPEDKDSKGGKEKGGKEDEKQQVVCAVCREPLAYDIEQLFSAPTHQSADIQYKPDKDMQKLQKKMAALYMKQKQKGGIIDIEAESNRFLIDISVTPTLPMSSVIGSAITNDKGRPKITTSSQKPETDSKSSREEVQKADKSRDRRPQARNNYSERRQVNGEGRKSGAYNRSYDDRRGGRGRGSSRPNSGRYGDRQFHRSERSNWRDDERRQGPGDKSRDTRIQGETRSSDRDGRKDVGIESTIQGETRSSDSDGRKDVGIDSESSRKEAGMSDPNNCEVREETNAKEGEVNGDRRENKDQEDDKEYVARKRDSDKGKGTRNEGEIVFCRTNKSTFFSKDRKDNEQTQIKDAKDESKQDKQRNDRPSHRSQQERENYVDERSRTNKGIEESDGHQQRTQDRPREGNRQRTNDKPRDGIRGGVEENGGYRGGSAKRNGNPRDERWQGKRNQDHPKRDQDRKRDQDYSQRDQDHLKRDKDRKRDQDHLKRDQDRKRDHDYPKRDQDHLKRDQDRKRDKDHPKRDQDMNRDQEYPTRDQGHLKRDQDRKMDQDHPKTDQDRRKDDNRNQDQVSKYRERSRREGDQRPDTRNEDQQRRRPESARDSPRNNLRPQNRPQNERNEVNQTQSSPRFMHRSGKQNDKVDRERTGERSEGSSSRYTRNDRTDNRTDDRTDNRPNDGQRSGNRRNYQARNRNERERPKPAESYKKKNDDLIKTFLSKDCTEGDKSDNYVTSSKSEIKTAVKSVEQGTIKADKRPPPGFDKVVDEGRAAKVKAPPGFEDFR